MVAPRAGAWIEAMTIIYWLACATVAPRAGAWIEAARLSALSLPEPSLPVRERGLKHLVDVVAQAVKPVAPRAGAWIEAPCR